MGITAKNDYQKPNPQNENTVKETSSVLSNRQASTASTEENWFLLATTVPLVATSIQIEAEVIDKTKIFSSVQPES